MSEYIIDDKAAGVDIFIKVVRRIHRAHTRFVVAQARESKSGFTVKGNINMITMTDSQSTTISIVAEDNDGNPAPVAAPPVWTASDASLTLAPAADGMSCLVTASATLGTPTVTVTGNGTLPGGGPDPADVITANIAFTIVAGEASQFAVTNTPPA